MRTKEQLLSEIKVMIDRPSVRDFQYESILADRRHWAEELELAERQALLSVPETELLDLISRRNPGTTRVAINEISRARMLELSQIINYVVQTEHDPNHLALLSIALPADSPRRQSVLKRLERKSNGGID